MSKVAADLSGVSETLLWPLYNRSVEARRPDSRLKDRTAVEIADTIDYPFERHFGHPDEYHVLRALAFDSRIKEYLTAHPRATVVGLGEGLETQVKRVDNGLLNWLAVDLEPTIRLRRQFLPDSPRHRNLVCSALDFQWMDEVDPTSGVYVTAQGLLMYFEPTQVREMIVKCAERFPGGRMLFDVIPRWYSENTMQGYRKTRNYTTPQMPFGMDVHEIPSIAKYSKNILSVREVSPGRGRSFHFRYKIPVMKMIPVVRNRRSSFVEIQFR